MIAGAVGIIAQHRQPAGVVHDQIEFIAMQYQQAAAIGEIVDDVLLDDDAAEAVADLGRGKPSS